ncbi:MAG: 50S ribosomal protein L21, partial [Lachnospiraceae bacterium]|nr:50S ribosomal protein L21 [Lachnospiraceae bacterium]
MYAIIATGGKQNKVSEGDVVRVEKLDAEVGSSYSFDQVLAVGEEGSLEFGKPVVEGAVVKATV